jgi:competence protein ComFB
MSHREEAALGIIDFHDIDELKNRNEEKVWIAIEMQLKRDTSLCRCRDCVLDVAAIALNRLPPRYQVYAFHSNELESLVPGDDVVEAVAKAFEMVARSPHH